VAGGSRPGDSVSAAGGWFVTVPSGSTRTVPIVVLHSGDPSMLVGNRTLFVMGAKR
jgi:hypothetical protein